VPTVVSTALRLDQVIPVRGRFGRRTGSLIQSAGSAVNQKLGNAKPIE